MSRTLHGRLPRGRRDRAGGDGRGEPRAARRSSRLHGFALDEEHVPVRRGRGRCGSATRSRPRRATRRSQRRRDPRRGRSTSRALAGVEAELDLRAARRSRVRVGARLRSRSSRRSRDDALAVDARAGVRPSRARAAAGSRSSAATTAGSTRVDGRRPPGRRPRRRARLLDATRVPRLWSRARSASTSSSATGRCVAPLAERRRASTARACVAWGRLGRSGPGRLRPEPRRRRRTSPARASPTRARCCSRPR